MMQESTPTTHLPRGFARRHVLHGHEKVVTRLSWAPDGVRLASAAQDGTIRIWDALKGELRRKLEMPGVFKLGKYYFTSDLESAIAWLPAWSLDGKTVVCGYGDAAIRIWDTDSGDLIGILEGHTAKVNSVAFSPDGLVLASSADDNTVKLWDMSSRTLICTLEGHRRGINNLAWHPGGHMLASGSLDGMIRIWDMDTFEPLGELTGHEDMVITVIWSPDGELLASSSGDATIRLWDAHSGLQKNILEGHSSAVTCIAFSHDGKLLASKSNFPDSTVRIWQVGTWDVLASLHEPSATMWFAGLAFHPNKLTLATLFDRDRDIRIWDLDATAMLAESIPEEKSIKYCTTKIALLGDSGVGKTGLGWRLAHSSFSEQPSTHGQQFWIIDALRDKRSDGADCEAVLWDLAGQPDYRLIHSLFLDDVDIGLLLFDPSDRERPFRGVKYWLKQVSYSHGYILPTILVGARIDRGAPTLTKRDLDEYCVKNDITGGYVGTSAKEGKGIDQLIDRIKSQIDWTKVPATITTSTFKKIKSFVLSLKQDSTWEHVLVNPKMLHRRALRVYPKWKITEEEIVTAVKYLQNHGHVRLLTESASSISILLFPDILINLASSIVLEARRHPQGLGALDEGQLLQGDYDLPEFRNLKKSEREILLGTTLSLFFTQNICFRESIGGKTYLIFPSLINEQEPQYSSEKYQEGGFYQINGAIENLYAFLVVSLSYTNTFTRTSHWQHQAQFELSPGQVCGFRLIAEREGSVEIVLYFGLDTPDYARLIFRGLFEKFISEREVSAVRYPSLTCPKCSSAHERTVIVNQLARGLAFVFCGYCGCQTSIPQADELAVLPLAEQRKLTEQRTIASRRTAFESAIVWIKNNENVRSATRPPECFISYAWGLPEHEKWVVRLATDLRNAAIEVVLDRWNNVPGTSITKFISRISSVDYVLSVGTASYRKKYEREGGDSVVDAELRMIGVRLLKASERRRKVIPLLLEGGPASSFPPQLEDLVFIDFRIESQYFAKLFDLILTVHEIPFDSAGIEDLRNSLSALSL